MDFLVVCNCQDKDKNYKINNQCYLFSENIKMFFYWQFAMHIPKTITKIYTDYDDETFTLNSIPNP